MPKNLVCRLTAPIPAALATIAIRGPDAQRLVGACIESPGRAHEPKSGELSRVTLVRWPVLDGSVSEEVVLCQVDAQTIELHCHGGIAVSNAILERLERAGCQIVDQETWRIRSDKSITPAWQWALSTAMDRLLIEATSDRSLGILLDQKAGALATCLQTIVRLAHSRQPEAARDLIEQLLRWQDLGMHLSKPWKVVLAGPPNVGKSSLINALSGQQRAIVHSEAGTTRDWIDVNIEIDGWSIRLTDTAGIRQTTESIEREGVSRAKEQILSADLVVIVVDATEGWTANHQTIFDLCYPSDRSPRILIAWNKSDLNPCPSTHLIGDEISVCCSAHSNVEPLLLAIAHALVPQIPSPGTPIPFNESLCRLLSQWDDRLLRSDFLLDLDELASLYVPPESSEATDECHQKDHHQSLNINGWISK
jgi:tRNA modification GTPase